MKTIELIDKYIVKQSEDSDYNPPSYIWSDNTGELIRCKRCALRNKISHECRVTWVRTKDDDFCSFAIMGEDE